MNETIRYCIDHSLDFLLFSIACTLLLNAIRKHVPEIKSLINELAHLLFKELKPGKNKTIPAQINAGVIKSMFIIAVLAGFPSALKHALGGDVGDITERTFYSSVLCLMIVSIFSPIWLYIMEREKRIRKIVDDALDQ